MGLNCGMGWWGVGRIGKRFEWAWEKYLDVGGLGCRIAGNGDGGIQCIRKCAW